MRAKSINVGVSSFTELFEAGPPLAIDNYQRPFVWNKFKIKQLLKDLFTYSKKTPNGVPDYYMGTLLLHHDAEKNRRFVIDGQQRLTALSVLHHSHQKTLPSNQDLTYRSQESITNIRRAKEYFTSADLQKLADDLFNRIRFTVIKVESEDLAFLFFDTQNYRGVPLNDTDLLKAFHLRAIQPNNNMQASGTSQQGGQYKVSSVSLQEDCARRWERLQERKIPSFYSDSKDFAATLFHLFLWRARCWTGQQALNFGSRDQLLEEFQDPIKPEAMDRVPVFAPRMHALATELVVTPGSNISLKLKSVPLTSHPAEFPFSIRQPISKGFGFFLYADKYAALLGQLLEEDPIDAEIKAFRTLYHQVISVLSRHLRDLFLLASLMFVDQFGHRQLLQFAHWLEHVLGAIRMANYSVFAQTPLRYLCYEPQRNLFDVIAHAFRPDQVIKYLETFDFSPYENEDKDPKTGEGVRGRYKQHVLEYYGNGHIDSLKGKSEWKTPNLSRNAYND